jgi:hypothetical protein
MIEVPGFLPLDFLRGSTIYVSLVPGLDTGLVQVRLHVVAD